MKKQLIEILNEWDLLGVLPNDGGPKDEYNGLAEQIEKKMNEFTTILELKKFLESEIIYHFGLPINDVQKNNIENYSTKIFTLQG